MNPFRTEEQQEQAQRDAARTLILPKASRKEEDIPERKLDPEAAQRSASKEGERDEMI